MSGARRARWQAGDERCGGALLATEDKPPHANTGEGKVGTHLAGHLVCPSHDGGERRRPGDDCGDRRLPGESTAPRRLRVPCCDLRAETEREYAGDRARERTVRAWARRRI